MTFLLSCISLEKSSQLRKNNILISQELSRCNRLAQLDDIRNMYLALNKIAMLKGNLNLIVEANKNIKRQFKPFEEAYILYGYEIPEQE
jgi:hypothetical protein